MVTISLPPAPGRSVAIPFTDQLVRDWLIAGRRLQSQVRRPLRTTSTVQYRARCQWRRAHEGKTDQMSCRASAASALPDSAARRSKIGAEAKPPFLRKSRRSTNRPAAFVANALVFPCAGNSNNRDRHTASPYFQKRRCAGRKLVITDAGTK